ncbi:uncharacterized protein [Elaeis guineensis]|uniref:uncharacterized protein isoform X1 n=1 Tax=Elaeis guineensis var. tenera TaxID=51953 RepID=UPI003C6D39E4
MSTVSGILKRPIAARGIQSTNPRSSMEERHFRRFLDRFPVVRSPYYCADTERESCTHSAKDERASGRNVQNEMVKKDALAKTSDEDPFWQKLRVAAEKKVQQRRRSFAGHFKASTRDLFTENLVLKLHKDSLMPKETDVINQH